MSRALACGKRTRRSILLRGRAGSQAYACVTHSPFVTDARADPRRFHHQPDDEPASQPARCRWCSWLSPTRSRRASFSRTHPGGNASLLRHARLVAQAELEVLRVRAARIALIKTLAEGLDAGEGSTRMLNAFLRALPQLLALERYERRTRSRRKRLVGNFSLAISISIG
jgi:hypothetical protein